MQIWTACAVAIGCVSFCLEASIVSPVGVAGSIGLAMASMFLPCFLERLLAAVWVRPDIVMVLDPLKPKASIITKGLKIALQRVVADGKAQRLWVGRVPGAVVYVDWNTVRRLVVVRVEDESGTVVSKSQASLPAFSCGAAPACFRIQGTDESARWVVRPALRKSGRITLEPFRLWMGWSLMGNLLLASVSGIWVGLEVTLWAVILPGMSRGLSMGLNRWKWGLEGQSRRPLRDVVVTLFALAFSLLNAMRVEIFY